MLFAGRIGLVAGIAVLTLVLNLPFGYLRQGVRKYSFRWFLYIHVPIPLIVLIRISSGLDYRVIPLFVAAAVAGQLVGGRLRPSRTLPPPPAR